MKKTLVALAVLAASGASIAQVTITGNFNYGFRSTTKAGSDASGLGIRDSNVTFGFAEDMGQGMKLNGQVKIDSLNRAGISGGDSFVTLTSAPGFVTLGTSEIDSDLNSISSNVSDAFLDNSLLGGAATGYYNQSDLVHDFVTVGTTYGPVAVSLSHFEGTPNNSYAGGLGLGVGSAANMNQRQNLVKAVYTAGALTAEASYGAFDNKTSNTYMSLDTVMTVAGNYNFGMVSVGAGFQRTAYTAGSGTETLLSVSMPLGALTLSAVLDSAKIDAGGTANAEGTGNGYGVAASYALSKRTAIRARYYNYDATLNPANRDSLTEVVLKHAF